MKKNIFYFYSILFSNKNIDKHFRRTPEDGAVMFRMYALGVEPHELRCIHISLDIFLQLNNQLCAEAVT